jgi:NAD(P)-dependent dehydrogenase (short-subunit alcohol dehydrogenase family)
VNVIGLIKIIEAFLPLVQAATGEKKVITISSGMSDLDLINSTDLDVAAAYAISKAGVNVAVAKYSALCRKEGILFMSICPGNVATERQTRGLLSIILPYLTPSIYLLRQCHRLVWLIGTCRLHQRRRQIPPRVPRREIHAVLAGLEGTYDASGSSKRGVGASASGVD